MADKPYDMKQHVARGICAASTTEGSCLHCNGNEECLLWETFMHEAEVAIECVRDFAIVQRRSKPRLRHPQALAEGPYQHDA